MAFDRFTRWKSAFSLLIALFFGMSGFGHGENIDWGSEASGNNQNSAGQSMDAGFTFQLGVFSNGFVPTAANLADWDVSWTVADEVAYNVSQNKFGSVHAVTDNTPPFLAGAEAWIMGTKMTPTGTEKILFRRPTWTWPAPNDMNPLGPVWRVNGDSNINVAIGMVNPGGAPFLMRSEITRTYDQWRAFALVGESLDGLDDDPDGDGLSNLLEFVFDTDPLDSTSRADVIGEVVEEHDGEYLQLAIPRRRIHVAFLTVQVSSDLETWEDGPSFTETRVDEPLQWVVRDKTPISSAGGRRFMRLKVDLPE